MTGIINRHLTMKRVEDAAFNLFSATRGYLLTRPIYSGAGVILVFHRVCPKDKRSKISGNLRLEITPEYLEDTIRFFRDNNYEIISLDELFEALKKKKRNKKFVVYTFDDGYADNLTYAYPVFKRHNAPFAVYVTTSFLDKQAILWWYMLEDLVLKNESISIKSDGKDLKFVCRTLLDKEKVFYELRSLIMGRHEKDYISQIQDIFTPHKVDLYEKVRELALSWEQVRELGSDPLVTIGAHTVNHLALSRLLKEAAIYEISESKKRLESYLDRDITHFTYPFGTEKEISNRELAIVRDCGFKTATTSRVGNIFPTHRSYMECLPRVPVSGEREAKDIRRLNLLLSGTASCMKNKFKRFVAL